MKNINDLSEDDQIKLINEYRYSPRDRWAYYNSINNPSEKAKLAIFKLNPNNISGIKKPSSLMQIEYIEYLFAKNFKIDKCDDIISQKFITCPKALKLYEKLKKVHSIIK
jgi:intein-encoded DNA endonuclease-like protein